jgi:hypothetical protein
MMSPSSAKAPRSRQCDAADARKRLGDAEKYLKVAELVATEDSLESHNVATGLAVLAGIAAADGALLVRTACYGVNMSVNVSVRLDDALAERLRLRARAAGESLSDRLRRYAEEGARREEHPLIVFRDGPTGRRAGLLGGPDVWEVAMWLDDLASEPDPVAELLADSRTLTRPQVDAVVRYRAVHPEEIEARIELHRRETATAEAY